MDATNDNDRNTAPAPLPNLAALPRRSGYRRPVPPPEAIVADARDLLRRIWQGDGEAMLAACARLAGWTAAAESGCDGDGARTLALTDALDRLEVAVREAPTTELAGLAAKAWLVRETLRDDEDIGAEASAVPTLVQGLFALVEAEGAQEPSHG